MRRLRSAFIAFAVAAVVGRANAAEITRVASSGEPRDPFDLDLSVHYARLQERATITREGALDELRFVRTRHAIVPRVAVGIYRDVELHVEAPYVLTDDRSWRFGDVNGSPSGGVFRVSSIESNPFDANGLTSTTGGTCTTAACPLFAVAPETTALHGGQTGDVKAGIAWAIFNERKDDTKPSWVVGTDVTFPTAKVYDPAKGPLSRGWDAPNTDATPAPFGEKVWKWDVYTALSRRMGIIDPYFKAHATTMLKSASTYSNCDHVGELASATPTQVNSSAVANCATWGDEAGAKLPWIAGITFGTEVVPYEDRAERQKVSFDLRLFADYTSPQRFYNELTDATGKIHQTGRYVTMGGLFSLYLRASEYITLEATASLATQSAHYLTGESLGKDGGTPALSDTSAINPNFDWRYDPAGRRFRISEVSIFDLGASVLIQF